MGDLAGGPGARSGWRVGLGFLAVPVGLLIAINGLNVVNSYVGRDFITAIENKDRGGFIRQAWRYVGVFALSTVAAFHRGAAGPALARRADAPAAGR